jgi:pSer/pThr/pTyr-binding forkhead associated (FHA) protein
VIICSRCGKENQDQFKYCLGCGLKLAPAAPVPAPVEPAKAAPAAQQATPPAKTFGPAPALTGRAPVAPTSGPANVASVPVPVQQPEPSRPRPVTPPQDQVTGAARTPSPPTAWRPGGAPSPSAAPAQPAPQAIAGPAVLTTPATAHGAISTPTAPNSGPAIGAPPPAAEPVICPRCGKTVAVGFAFCGTCGHRLKIAAGAVVEAAQHAAHLAPEPRVLVRGQLTLIRPDGSEGGVHVLQQGETLIGRGQGHLFDADPYLSPRHCEFSLSQQGLQVRDLHSLNGVFVRLAQEEPLQSGDTFRIGQELLRFDVINPPAPLEDGTEIIGTPNPGYWGRLSVIVGRDMDGPAFPLFDETVVLGRERGDILFPEDGYVSGTHAQITLRDGRVYLADLGSSNGTFLRVRESRPVTSGSLLLMGQQLFRVAYQSL